MAARVATVAVWQGKCLPPTWEATLIEAKETAARSSQSGAEVLLFPELFACSYDQSLSKKEVYESSRCLQSEELKAVSALAKEFKLCIGFPYPERASEPGSMLVYNSCAVFSAAGEIVANYRKVQLFGDWENSCFEAGCECYDSCFDLPLSSGICIRCGILICFDIEFPEPARCLAMQGGAELLLVPTALGHEKVKETTPCRVLPTRAVENHVFIMYSNFEGSFAQKNGGTAEFCGLSAILAPNAEELARADTTVSDEPKLLTATLKLDCHYDDNIRRNPYLTVASKHWEDGLYRPLASANPTESRGPAREKLAMDALHSST